jgi:UDP-N-acetylglucosamine 2-epimerase (non-hydrolysing)
VHLAREGIASDKIHFVGNVMVDSLLTHLPAARQRETPAGQYAVLTLHRPSNVDDPQVFEKLMGAIDRIAQHLPVIFPVHPRTAARVASLKNLRGDIRTMEPLGYLDFLALTSKARLILTDSGGIQEESTVLGVPCLTMRENTERPVTISHGTNRLIGTEPDAIVSAALDAIRTPKKSVSIPPLWDGKAAERIVDTLLKV